MPCYKINTAPSGYGKIGTTGYATEAECLEACKEGACCNGTTCSVKPQCQCVCETGSCCGPDTQTVNGITGPRCRGQNQITRSECIAAGGVWRCNTPCDLWGGDLEAGVQALPCTSLTGQNEPVFKGVGTTCTPNPCYACPTQCAGSPIPDEFQVTVSGYENPYCFLVNGTWTAKVSQGICFLWRANIPQGQCNCVLGFAPGVVIDMRGGNSTQRHLVVRLVLQGPSSIGGSCFDRELSSQAIVVPWSESQCPLPLSFNETISGGGQTANISFTIPATNPLP